MTDLLSQVSFKAFNMNLVFRSIQVLLEGEDVLEPYERDTLKDFRSCDERINLKKFVPAVEYLHLSQTHDLVTSASPFDRAELSGLLPSPVFGDDVYVVDSVNKPLRQ